MSIIENIQAHLNKNDSTARVFIELRKVFDIVDHDILFTNFNHYGVRELANDWFGSSLKGRQQFVSIANEVSTIKEIVSGVHQGSVLVHYYSSSISMISSHA